MIPIISSGFIPMDISIKQHASLVENIISRDLNKSKEILIEHIKSLILTLDKQIKLEDLSNYTRSKQMG